MYAKIFFLYILLCATCVKYPSAAGARPRGRGPFSHLKKVRGGGVCEPNKLPPTCAGSERGGDGALLFFKSVISTPGDP